MIAVFSQSSSQQSRGTSALCSLTRPWRRCQSWNLLAVTPSQETKRWAGISVRFDQWAT